MRRMYGLDGRIPLLLLLIISTGYARHREEPIMDSNSSSKKNVLKKGSSLFNDGGRDTCTMKPLTFKIWTGKTAQGLQFVALIMILVSTVILFTLPIVFQYVQVNKKVATVYTNSTVATNCSNNPKTSRLSATDPCQQQLYEGSICTQFLGSMQRCLLGVDSEDIRIVATSRELAEVENDVVLLNSLLSSFPACQEVAIPFLCHHHFPLIDCSSEYIYSASREECITITTTVCSAPWTIAVSAGYGDQLPNCQELLPAYDKDFINTTDTTSITDNEVYGTDNITCRDDFMKVNSTCLPACGKFDQLPPDLSDVIVYSEVTAGCVAIIVAIIIIACAARDYKKMFTYYNIMSILGMVDYTLLALFALIMEFDRRGLYCSSSSLLDAFDNPTIFCKISGAVFHYGIVNLTLWWFFHVSVFLYKISYPFHARRFELLGRQKYMLLVMILIGLLFPLPAVMISLSIEEHNYQVIRMPPTFCLPSVDMWFYSAILVIDVLLCLGVCFLVIVFWVIRKHLSRYKNKKFVLNTAEKKVMIVIGIFLIFGVVIMTHSSLSYSKSNVEQLAEAYNTYIACESVGHTPGMCDRTSIEKYAYPYLSIASYLLLGLLPVSILNLVVNWQSAMKKFQRYLSQHIKPVFKHKPKQFPSAAPSSPI